MLYPLLLALVLLVSLHDLYHARVPNWVTLPLLGIGLLWNFPGALETWLACLLLFAAWRAGWIGGGDAKLWMAMLWLAPAAQAQAVTTNVSTGLNTSASPALVMSGAFALTAMLQFLWRKFRPALPVLAGRPGRDSLALGANTANVKTPLTVPAFVPRTLAARRCETATNASPLGHLNAAQNFTNWSAGLGALGMHGPASMARGLASGQQIAAQKAMLQQRAGDLASSSSSPAQIARERSGLENHHEVFGDLNAMALNKNGYSLTPLRDAHPREMGAAVNYYAYHRSEVEQADDPLKAAVLGAGADASDLAERLGYT